jgi:hypothetical protein
MVDELQENEFSEYYSTCDWCMEIVQKHERSTSILMILERLEGESKPWAVLALKEELSRQYVMSKEYDVARDILEEITQLRPKSEMAFSNLASHYFYVSDQPEKALKVILTAEKLSLQSGNFRRHVLAQKARIALALDDYVLLNDTLNLIAELVVHKGQRDVRKERDFFDQADIKLLPYETVKKFQNYLGSN